jgi:predicted secreted protein
MALFECFVIYIVIWWVLFFIALPLGVKRSKNLLPGHDSGAPEKTYLWKKFITGKLFIITKKLMLLSMF